MTWLRRLQKMVLEENFVQLKPMDELWQVPTPEQNPCTNLPPSYWEENMCLVCICSTFYRLANTLGQASR